MDKLFTSDGGMEQSSFVRKQQNVLIMESSRKTLDHFDMSIEDLLMILSRPKSMMMGGMWVRPATGTSGRVKEHFTS